MGFCAKLIALIYLSYLTVHIWKWRAAQAILNSRQILPILAYIISFRVLVERKRREGSNGELGFPFDSTFLSSDDLVTHFPSFNEGCFFPFLRFYFVICLFDNVLDWNFLLSAIFLVVLMILTSVLLAWFLWCSRLGFGGVLLSWWIAW